MRAGQIAPKDKVISYCRNKPLPFFIGPAQVIFFCWIGLNVAVGLAGWGAIFGFLFFISSVFLSFRLIEKPIEIPRWRIATLVFGVILMLVLALSFLNLIAKNPLAPLRDSTFRFILVSNIIFGLMLIELLTVKAFAEGKSVELLNDTSSIAIGAFLSSIGFAIVDFKSQSLMNLGSIIFLSAAFLLVIKRKLQEGGLQSDGKSFSRKSFLKGFILSLVVSGVIMVFRLNQ